MLHRIASISILVLSVVGELSVGTGAEHIVFQQDGKTHDVTGKALVEYQDGGILLQSRDGQIWTILPEEIQDRQSSDEPLVPLTQQETVEGLLAEFGGEFQVHPTAHFLVVSNADDRFVTYCKTLFERLYKGFYAFWKNNGIDLPEPEFPLVALVFDDRASFQRYAKPEAGDAAEHIIGYYNLKTNRMTTFDVSEGAGARAGIHVVDRNIATLIHEATHQLSYNCGLQRRYADNPYWVSEGMAVFFESPDLRRSDGWRKIGRINEVNRLRFAKYLPARPADSLMTLLQDDTRFKNSTTATTAYGEAWALTYFLVKTKPEAYVAYLEKLRNGEYLEELSPRQRLTMFRDAFGDLQKLDQQFITYTRRFVLRR